MTTCCGKSRRRFWGPGGLTLLLLTGAVSFAIWTDRNAKHVESLKLQPLKLAQRAPTGALRGDVEHGRQLYAMNCSSCHGIEADGKGPGADYLWPLPRDHRDAAYMLSRPDDQLFKAVSHGGRGVSRSYLMPAWNDVFDRFQTWNLVAFMRSLTPEFPEGVRRATYHEVYLSDERHAKVAPLGFPRRVGFIRCLSARPDKDGDEEEYLKHFMVFPGVKVGNDSTTLSLLFNPDAQLIRASTLHQIQVEGASQDAMDRYLEGLFPAAPQAAEIAGHLAGMLTAARDLMRVLLEQENLDRVAAEVVYRRSLEAPQSLSRGERLYLQNCAACHGTTGRVVGPQVTEREAWPRFLADGSVMSLLSDDYLRSLIRKGGLHWNLSGAMPANPSLKDEEINDIVAHVRALGDPRGNGRCPCGTVSLSCGSKKDNKGCCCLDEASKLGLCAQMKR